jgi:hypothetical protein
MSSGVFGGVVLKLTPKAHQAAVQLDFPSAR